MNPHASQVVELAAVRRLLSSLVASPLGEERLARLMPSHSRRVVHRRLARTSEAIRLLEKGESPQFERVADPAVGLRRAAAEAVLSGEELFGVGRFVTEAVRLGSFFRDRTSECPHLCNLLAAVSAQAWDTLEGMETALRSAVDAKGMILDEASTRLRRIRAALQATDSRVRDAAHLAVKELGVREALQETVVHYRGGRPVLPVKASLKDKVPGVLRDVSASGATLFIEPVEAARLGRQRERLLKEHDKEERRIRRELTIRIAALAPVLSQLRGVVGRMELAFAAAAFGHSRGGVCAELSTDGTLDLRMVRHPLLPSDSVPLSLRLDGSARTLLITGPNTGGKTVALKSVGLAVLMTACGLPVLGHEGTTVPVVRDVLADIGDEQSIEQSLSTFSGHMSNLVEVIRRVTDIPAGHCLVLLDELGAGTDPAEGEALGCAILEWLHSAGGTRLRLLATSHFARLKELVAAAEGMANARMEFDPATLRPTYELSMGAAGASQAFPVAQRLGLSESVLARARDFLGPERVEFQRLVAALDTERYELNLARRQASDLAAQLEREVRAVSEEATAARDELSRAHADFRKRAEDVLTWSRQELKKARAEEGFAAAQRRHLALHEAIASVPDVETTAGPPVTSAPFRPGDEVLVEGLGRGSVESLKAQDSAAVVLIRGVRIETPLSRLRAAPPARPGAVSYVTLPDDSLGPELVLLGLRADEARERVIRYLDDAHASDMNTVRIVHGLGRGVLKEIVRDALQRHPMVTRFRYGSPEEGGQGVTVAHLH